MLTYLGMDQDIVVSPKQMSQEQQFQYLVDHSIRVVTGEAEICLNRVSHHSVAFSLCRLGFTTWTYDTENVKSLMKLRHVNA